jgi:two-component system, NarL family, nitrate/nitrite response regulator NarL
MAAEPIRVLAIVGHPVILGVIRLACEDAGVQVMVEAHSGGAGLAAWPDPRIDAVVLDLDLRDADGLDVLSAIRIESPDVPVVIVSERAEGATVLDALSRGAAGYLTKSEGLRRTGEVVLRVVAGERVVDPALEAGAVGELGRFARQAREGVEGPALLTGRERQILSLVAEGLTVKQVGRRLRISPRTVETHLSNLYRKLGVRTRVQAVSRASALGLLELR